MKRSMLKLIVLLVFLCAGFSLLAHAQSPSAAPVASSTPAVSAPVTTAPSGLAGWVSTQGGLIAAVTLIATCLNMVFATLTTIFSKLSMAEPKWMQVVGGIAYKIVQILSANTSTPAPIVQAAIAKQSTTTTPSS